QKRFPFCFCAVQRFLYKRSPTKNSRCFSCATMTVFNLLTFPYVCRACLQSVHPDQMVAIDTHRPQLETTIGTFLQDISFQPPEEIQPFLPSEICITCLEVMEFFSKYRRKMRHLHEFLVALVRVKQGEETSLRQMFEQKTDQLELLFRDLDLCNRTDAGVDDLLDEYHQYTIASMTLDDEQDQPDEPQDDSTDTLLLYYGTEEDTEEKESVLLEERYVEHRTKKLKIELDAGAGNEVKDGATSSTPAQHVKKRCEGSERSKFPQIKSECKRLQCDQCSYNTMYGVAYNIHKTKHKENEGKTGHTCSDPYCLQLFETAEELKAHKANNTHKIYLCELCGAKLKQRTALEVHLERHMGITHFQCRYCSSSFHTKTELYNHIAAMHISEDRAECEQCGAMFTSNKLLKQHLESHRTVRNFRCSQCDRLFKTQHQLKRHIVSVHHVVRFQCEHCDVSYSRRDKLRMHVERAHQIQTYFVCEICVRSFDTEDALREHRYHHEHPQQLECGTCLMVCLTQRGFDQHTCLSYQDDYVCCGRDFKYHMLYNKHMMMRHNIKVNARVKPKTDLLLGQERALRKTSGKKQVIKKRNYVCGQCGQCFDTVIKRRKHQCVAVATQAVVIETGTALVESVENLPAFDLQIGETRLIEVVAPADMFG
uniref:C2H2-type domain-containing protein n=1 Tax=Anopheles dirus TaxID=7168 RepID=A0A182NM63_9DIPT